jgi:hypothetical protein
MKNSVTCEVFTAFKYRLWRRHKSSWRHKSEGHDQQYFLQYTFIFSSVVFFVTAENTVILRMN